MSSDLFRKNISFSEKRKMLLERLVQKEAEVRSSQLHRAPSASRPAVLPRIDRASHPLSLLQKSAWTYEQLMPGEHLLSVLSFQEPLDLALLRRSWQALTERHELLRAVFPGLDGLPAQTILPSRSIDFSLIDLSSLEDDAARQILAHYLDPGQPHLFDLARGPLYECQLVRITDTEHLFLLSIHPLLADHATLALLCHELRIIYQGFVSGQASPLP